MALDVLICDDDADVRMLLELTVRAYGHAPRSVGSADAALMACRDRLPDLLLLDVSMPDKDGPMLLVELREASLEPDRTVLVSAITADELDRVATQLGVACLTKPFQPTDIGELLAA